MARPKLSFTTCNLYNLNEPGLRIYQDTDGWSREQYDEKIAWAAQAIARFESDVYGFQELWHRDSLAALFDAAGLRDDYYLVVPPGHAGQHIICAAAVRKGMLRGEPQWIEAFPAECKLQSTGDDTQTPDIHLELDSFSRPVLRFEIEPPGTGEFVSVYVAHLKSKRATPIYRESWYDKEVHGDHREGIGAALATIRRTAEAAALRVLLTKELKGTDRGVVVLGDLNDSQHSNTLNILTGQPNYLHGLSRGGSDVDLYTVGTLQEYRSLRDVYYTHVHQNFKESLDHILVSQEFYDNCKRRKWVFAGMKLLNDHLDDEDHKLSGSTDHGLVRAVFDYRPA